jgi:hypothetical protein
MTAVQRLAKMVTRTPTEILEGQQCFVRSFAYLADCLQSRDRQCILNARRKSYANPHPAPKGKPSPSQPGGGFSFLFADSVPPYQHPRMAVARPVRIPTMERFAEPNWRLLNALMPSRRKPATWLRCWEDPVNSFLSIRGFRNPRLRRAVRQGG